MATHQTSKPGAEHALKDALSQSRSAVNKVGPRVDEGSAVFLPAPMPQNAKRVLCICADDFGLRQGVNDAILFLLDRSRLQAVSCMVGPPAWGTGSVELSSLSRSNVDVGLHLDLTEQPLMNGSKLSLSKLIIACTARLIRPQRLRQEIDAQLDAFEDGVGRVPAYVDGHQHVHQLPVVREQLLAALAERYGKSPPWVRSTRSACTSFKAKLIEQLGGRAFIAMADNTGIRHNSRLLGVYDFCAGEASYRALVRQWLRIAASGDLLMCHPGIGPDVSDSIAAARQAEFSIMANEAFGEILRTEGLALQPISAWLEAPID